MCIRDRLVHGQKPHKRYQGGSFSLKGSSEFWHPTSSNKNLKNVLSKAPWTRNLQQSFWHHRLHAHVASGAPFHASIFSLASFASASWCRSHPDIPDGWSEQQTAISWAKRGVLSIDGMDPATLELWKFEAPVNNLQGVGYPKPAVLQVDTRACLLYTSPSPRDA